MDPERTFSFIENEAEACIRELRELCRMESVSAQSRGIDETAEAVREILSGLGAKSEILRAEGANPAVSAEIRGDSEKTLLFYNHYDVQPPEPLDEWKFEPFSAEMENGILYARGAADNKGDFIARVSAVRALQQTFGKLPANVKFFVEGGEEIGSPGLDKIIEDHPASISADACVWETGRKTFDGRPVIFLGVKGMLYVELSARSAKTDANSSLATTVPNPAWTLTWALNSLKDREEKIKIPGFYDGIAPLSETEISMIRKIPDEDEAIKAGMGINGFISGLSGFEKNRRDIEAPTCTICGLHSGYTGAGSKTVLPSTAAAKIDFRLVPGQDPDDILEKLKSHLAEQGFESISVESFTREKAFKTPADSEFAGLVEKTAGQAYGFAPVVYPIMPGTGPMHAICGKYNTPCAGTGIANAGSNIHAPNENIKFDDFIAGIKHAALIIGNF